MNGGVRRFRNRAEAGDGLGAELKAGEYAGALVLGIPRGGVEVAFHVARALRTAMSILVVRKLPFPANPEAGFGALAEDGSLYVVPEAARLLPHRVMDDIVAVQRAEVARRVSVYRGGQSLPDLHERPVLVVDDGIAMGSTTQAAVLCCRNLGARRVTVASPVASPEAHADLELAADDVVVLSTPPLFRAVGEFYDEWRDLSDGEVVALADRARREGFWAGVGPGGAPP